MFKNARILSYKGSGKSMVKRTVDDVGVTLKLFAASVAEVFGLLLDILNQRLQYARMVVMGRKREDDLIEWEHTNVLNYSLWESLVGCRKICFVEGVMLGSLDYGMGLSALSAGM